MIFTQYTAGRVPSITHLGGCVCFEQAEPTSAGYSSALYNIIQLGGTVLGYRRPAEAFLTIEVPKWLRGLVISRGGAYQITGSDRSAVPSCGLRVL
jgi:hypothetical protein